VETALDEPAAGLAQWASEPATAKELTQFALLAARQALYRGKPSEALAYVRVAEAADRLAAGPGAVTNDPNPPLPPGELEARAADLRARAPEIIALVEAKCGPSRRRE